MKLAAVARVTWRLGTCWWPSRPDDRDGTLEGLDQESLSREISLGARAWCDGDANTARNRLRAAFELLTQARERFYPVDAYIVDLCLIDPALPGGVLAEALSARFPITFIAPARAIEAQAHADPASLEKLLEAIGEGWADVAGGAYEEVAEPHLPLGSILWQLRQGASVYRAHLGQRTVESLARRRFGLYPQLPQIARRFGFRFALHMGFDAGRFPVRPEAKRLWESPDHSSLETLTRPPLGADRALSGLQLPWRLARSMRDDHVATLPLLHWPSPVAGWYDDLRRVASYSPSLARCVTLNDYFHLTDRPYETFSPEIDSYATPYLAQATDRGDTNPISRGATHTALRTRYDALSTLRAMAEALGSAGQPAPESQQEFSEVERSLETGRYGEVLEPLARLEQKWSQAAAAGVLGSTSASRPGFLVINPVGYPRRVPVLLPDAAADLRPEGPLRAAQFTDEGVWAIVDLPAFGFAWVPRDTEFEASPAPLGVLTVRDRVLRNEHLSVEIDGATGGIRGIMALSEETPRIGQQLVIAGLTGPDSQPASSRMRCESFEVEYGGPALIQAVSAGSIVGPGDHPIARFRQRYRLWTGRPLLEIDVTLSDMDPVWLKRIANADPWAHYLACRWAWPDPNAMMRRTALSSPEVTDTERPETPDAIDLSTRRQRTAVVFGGLAHHRRHGGRMLDTLLVAGRETERSFRLGVQLEADHLFVAASELRAPVAVVPASGPPAAGPTGWLFLLDSRSVAVSSVEYIESPDESRGWGLAFNLLETAGQPVRCRLRTFRAPTWARQVDFQDNVIVDLPLDGDAVMIDLTPHELARVEVTLG
ncbi:MAG: glycosyl hydrolase family 38 [Isosphaeraceae bacterium]